MSYNGIGLVTPRGSGTSGYVQRNLAELKKTGFHLRKKSPFLKLKTLPVRKPNKIILEHKRKRRIEVLCAQLRQKLEKQGKPEAEIALKENDLRQKHKNSSLEDLEDNAVETHAKLKAQQKRNERLRSALKINKDHKTGEAFHFAELKQKRDEEKLKRTAEERLRSKKNYLSREEDFERMARRRKEREKGKSNVRKRSKSVKTDKRDR
ncbi:Serine/arginine repetitive matrix protein 2, partial [Bonamia ostreae]